MLKLRALVVAIALICFAGAAAPAQAAPCDGLGAEQPFLDWGDDDLYVLADGGDFESPLDGWQLRGGASVVEGGNTLRPRSSGHSLALPAGSSATSAPICVSSRTPTARLFSTTGARAYGSLLKVEVLYLDRATGAVERALPLSALTHERAWDASRRIDLAQALFDLDPETDRGAIRLRFTPLLGSDWRIDDVFIDPRHRI